MLIGNSFPDEQIIVNQGSGALLVYPPSLSATIDGNAAGIPVSIPSKGYGAFYCQFSTICYTVRPIVSPQAPTGLPTCGTGCNSLGTGSTDNRMLVTTGTAATAVTVNFSTTLPQTPVCIAAVEGVTASTVTISAKSTSAFTLTLGTALTSQVIDVLCQ